VGAAVPWFRSVGTHVGSISAKLGPVPSGDGDRRVRAVLACLPVTPG
jgi:hypothetical protein